MQFQHTFQFSADGDDATFEWYRCALTGGRDLEGVLISVVGADGIVRWYHRFWPEERKWAIPMRNNFHFKFMADRLYREQYRLTV